jgi:hypothetical protein
MTYQDADLRMYLTDAQIAGAANSFAHNGIIRIVDLFEADMAKNLHQKWNGVVWSARVKKHGI